VGKTIRGLTETCALSEFDCHGGIFKSLSKVERHTCCSGSGSATQPNPRSSADTMLPSISNTFG
jgi:hypothetical protein